MKTLRTSTTSRCTRTRRRRAAALLLPAACLLLATGCAGDLGPASDPASHDLALLGVDDVAQSPVPLAGRVAVEGVVSRVLPASQAFTVIDVKEYASCGLGACAANFVAVTVADGEVQGKLPALEDKVVVVGDLTAGPESAGDSEDGAAAAEPVPGPAVMRALEVHRRGRLILTSAGGAAAAPAGVAGSPEVPAAALQ